MRFLERKNKTGLFWAAGGFLTVFALVRRGGKNISIQLKLWADDVWYRP